jgi:hypothetical protein
LLTYLALLCSVLRSEFRARQDLVAENLALRQQLAVLTRPKRRPRLTRTDRRSFGLKMACASNNSSALAPIVGGQPDSVRRVCLGGGTTTKRRLRTPRRMAVEAEVR